MSTATKPFTKIRLPNGTDNAIGNGSVGLLTIVAACEAVFNRKTTLLTSQPPGCDEVTVAAIVPADQVRNPAEPSNWAKLRESVATMAGNLREQGDIARAQALHLVLDEMTTIELAELCPGVPGRSWQRTALSSAMRSLAHST